MDTSTLRRLHSIARQLHRTAHIVATRPPPFAPDRTTRAKAEEIQHRAAALAGRISLVLRSIEQ